MSGVKRNSKLKYVQFGNSDLKVSECIIGSMTWGSWIKEEEEAYAQLDKAIEMGVNFIDTAELYPVAFNYGKTTEAWIGNWLEARVKEGRVKRKDLVIASKCNPKGIGAPEKKDHAFDAATLRASCVASLKRLKCEYLDLYMLHWPCRNISLFGAASALMNKSDEKGEARARPEAFEESILAVKALLDEGLIRYWGLSNENAYGVTMFCTLCDKLGVPRPISIQNDFALTNRLFEGDVCEAVHRFGLVGMPYGGLAGGVLTGKYFDSSKYSSADKDRPIKECRHRANPEFQPRYGFPTAMRAAEKYIQLAEKHGLTPAELALAFSKSRWYNAAVIIGSTTVRQVEENVNALKIDLSEEILKEIDQIHEEFRNPSNYYSQNPKLCDAAPWLQSPRAASIPE